MPIFGWLISVLPTVSPRPRTDVDDAFWQDIGEQAGHLQRCQRRLFRRLEDDGIAPGNRRCQLPGHHHQRIVPWRDRTDNANGIAADHRGMAGQIFAGDRRMQVTDRAGKEAPAIDDGRQFVIAHRIDRLATVQGFQRRKGIGILLDRIGDFQEIAGALAGCRHRPGDKRLFGGIDGALDLRLRGFGKIDDPGAGARIEDQLLGLRSGLECRSDQQLGVHRGLHWG